MSAPAGAVRAALGRLDRRDRAVTAGLVALVGAGTALAPTAAGAAMTLAVGVVAVVALALVDAAAALVLLVATSFLRTVLQGLDAPVPVPLLLAGVALAGLAVAVARGRLDVPSFGLVELAMVAYLAWNVVSWASPHDLVPLGPISVPVLLASGIAFPFGMYVIGRAAGGSERLVRAVLWSVVAATAFSALQGFLQFHSVPVLDRARVAVTPSWTDRAVGVFDQPVTNGVLLVLGVLACAMLASTTGSRPVRALLLVVAVAATYTIYLTHTRAVWLAAVVVAVLAVTVRETRRGALAVLAAGALVLAANWASFVGADRGAGGVGSTSEVEDRLNMIATAWWAIGEHTWLGWGVARFQDLNVYYHQQWSSAIDWKRGLGIASHENELGIAAELGIVGLALWVAVLAALAHRVWAVIRRAANAPARRLGLLAGAALVTLVVVGTTVDLRYLDFAEGLVLLLVGLAVGRAAPPAGPVPADPLPAATDPGPAADPLPADPLPAAAAARTPAGASP